VDGQIVQVFDNLRGQFSRRREDKRARRPARLPDHVVQDRQQERRGLAAAVMHSQQVLAGHGQRNGISLNGRRTRKTEIFEPLKQAGMESEFGKWHGSL